MKYKFLQLENLHWVRLYKASNSADSSKEQQITPRLCLRHGKALGESIRRFDSVELPTLAKILLISFFEISVGDKFTQ